MKRTPSQLPLLALAAAAGPAAAQNEQFVPATSTGRTLCAGGSGFGGGMIDYFASSNERDRGITASSSPGRSADEYRNDARRVLRALEEQGPTGASVIHPLSTGITNSLIEKATADKIPVTRWATAVPMRRRRVFRTFPADHHLLVAETPPRSVHRHEGRRDGQAAGKKIVNIYHDSAYGKDHPGA